MIGQKRVKELVSLILSANQNVLIVGPSGHGKTLLASEACPGSSLYLDIPEAPIDLLDYPAWNCPSRFVICNEIHASKDQDLWAIFLDAFLGAVVFTTTNPEKLIEALKTRTVLVELEPYTVEDMMKISKVFDVRMGELSRFVPRKAANLGALYREFDGSFEDFLEVLGVKEYLGKLLYPEEVRYLEYLNGEVKGKNLLKTHLNIANFEEVELSLLRLGLIEVTERGRKCRVL